MKKVIKEMGLIGLLRYVYRHGYVNKFKSFFVKRYIMMCGARVGRDVIFSRKPYVSNKSGVVIGDDCFIGAEILATTKNGKIMIGSKTHIITGIIEAKNLVRIGHNVKISGKCFIVDTNHSDENAKKTVVVGDNTWIGYGAILLPGSAVGSNCIVGAGAVVTKRFGDNILIAGNPAVEKKKIVNCEMKQNDMQRPKV